MRVHRNVRNVPPEARGCAVAIGNFDGVHRGHRAVIETARRQASDATRLAVLTFEPHPREVVKPATAPLRLTTLRRKIELLRALGIRHLFLLRFDAALMAMPAEAFIQEILVDGLGIEALSCGEGFRFGHRRLGDDTLLARAAGQLGFRFAPAPPVLDAGLPCSSTRIRAALDSGDLATANRLLGYPFTLSGIVRHGDHRGRTIGFPTANMAPALAARQALPARGVYAVRAGLRGPDGMVWHAGVANLGRRPTFDGNRLLLETHLFDVTLDLYGRRLDVVFLERLRDEMKFDGIEALKAQIGRDCLEARRINDRALF